eukprot:TRINITY_DN5649_c0_g1_i1.p1 TRINITY_DN5649_c0_g1~~TRINITY_DN5649_c0_g1_i1.p1  ORF type:complete len:544 (+),score=77.58 TRINITY_DN5649_c0_g1_i1:67-1698(+)
MLQTLKLLSNVSARPGGAMRLSTHQNHGMQIPISLDESKMPVGLDDASTASYLKQAFIYPYHSRSGGYQRLENHQRNYLAYRITVDVGRLRKRNCTIGPLTREVQCLLYTWFGIPKKCRELYADMDEKGIVPTKAFFNNLLLVHAKRGDHDHWKKYRAAMKKCNIAPNAATYNSLLVLISETDGNKNNRLSMAKHALRSMNSDGITATETTITSALHCCCSFEQGMKLLMAIETNCKIGRSVKRPLFKFEPITVALIRCCSHNGEVDPAEDLLNELQCQGINGVRYWNEFLRVVHASGDLERFLNEVDRMSKSGVVANNSTYMTMLTMMKDTAATSSPAVKKCLASFSEDILKQAIVSKHLRSVPLYELLIEVYLSCGMESKVQELQESMSRIGIVISTKMKTRIQNNEFETSIDNGSYLGLDETPSKSEGLKQPPQAVPKKEPTKRKAPSSAEDFDAMLKRISFGEHVVIPTKKKPPASKTLLSESLSQLQHTDNPPPAKVVQKAAHAPNILTAFDKKSASPKLAKERLLNAVRDSIRLTRI